MGMSIIQKTKTKLVINVSDELLIQTLTEKLINVYTFFQPKLYGLTFKENSKILLETRIKPGRFLIKMVNICLY
jgi:hypothetical protein